MLRRLLIHGTHALLTVVWLSSVCSALDVFVGDSSFEDVALDPSSAVIDGPGTWATAFGGGFADRSFLADPPLYPSQSGDYLGNIFVTDEGNFAAL